MHNFHIPVMGVGFTVDTPVKVAHLGISSVISLIDDMLIEKMREYYCKKFQIPYQEITNKMEDFRARRITSYLNTIDRIVKDRFSGLKRSAAELGRELDKYLDLLPDLSPMRQRFNEFRQAVQKKKEDLQSFLDSLVAGDIDVNIMTRLDKSNFSKGEKLPVEYNDAHAALRGFALSELNGSVVLSAGMNPRLYEYMEQFSDFYPDDEGKMKKRIILKVSDYRSALIQGKYLAKKGLWVSEYRMESGLNCGGHAFATQGILMGPILEEFRERRAELRNATFTLYADTLRNRQKPCPEEPPSMKITAQGGIGTHDEHAFLMDYYRMDSVGWGTPFLLVPEVVNMDGDTLQLLKEAGTEDLYLSDTSPLGVPFNTVKNNTKDLEKEEWIKQGKPGSLCPKKYAAINSDGLCTGSRMYQRKKIRELDSLALDAEAYRKAYDRITVKSCICVGLGTSALLVNNLDRKAEGPAVSVCPGPNLAYFNHELSLKEMVDHIYGRENHLAVKDRPNMFVNELALYVNYLKKELQESEKPMSEKRTEYFSVFRTHLLEGISYYHSLVRTLGQDACHIEPGHLEKYKAELDSLVIG